VQATIDIDAQLLQAAERLARQRGEPLSLLIEHALRESLFTATSKSSTVQYGEPLTDEDIDEAGRVTFSMLDQDEGSSEAR
jgi:hypothetical protein